MAYKALGSFLALGILFSLRVDDTMTYFWWSEDHQCTLDTPVSFQLWTKYLMYLCIGLVHLIKPYIWEKLIKVCV